MLQFLGDGALRNLFIGMTAAGLSVYFRDEFYVLCLVLALCTARYTRADKLKTLAWSALTLGLALLPLWLLQWQTIGHPFGYHISTHLATVADLLQHLGERPRVIYNLFIASTPIPVLSLALAAPLAVAVALNPRLAPAAWQRAVPPCAAWGLVASGMSLGGYFLAHSPIDYMLKSANAFFVTAPFIALACPRLDRADEATGKLNAVRWIWLVGVGFAALYALTAPKVGSMGIHWGNRFLLLLYPLLALLAALNLVEWFARKKNRRHASAFAIGTTIAFSLAAQLYGISVLKEKKAFAHRLNSTIAQRGEEVVITNQRWVPHALYGVFYQRPIFYVPTPRHLDRLLQRLSASDYRTYIFITRRGGPAQPTGTIDDGPLNYFDLHFFAATLPGR